MGREAKALAAGVVVGFAVTMFVMVGRQRDMARRLEALEVRADALVSAKRSHDACLREWTAFSRRDDERPSK